MQTFTISGAVLQACAIFASTDRTRFVLNGVLIELTAGDSFANFVGVDGRRMLAVRDHLGTVEITETRSAIIPTSLIKKVGKGDLVITLEAKTVSLETESGLIYSAALINGTFPDWRKVVPAQQGESQILALRPEYVADAAKAFALLFREKGAAFTAPKLDVPCMARQISGGGARDAIAIIMPIRSESIPKASLNWAYPLPTPKEEPAAVAAA